MTRALLALRAAASLSRHLVVILVAATVFAACNCGGSAEQLAFVVQPTSASAGAVLAPAIQVAVQDADGKTVTSSSATVTLALGPGSSHASLRGTVTVQAVNGIATFDTLSIQEAASGYTLFATSGGLDPVTSDAFDISAGASARLAFAVQPSNVQAGGAISPAVQVRIEDAYGNLTTSTADVGMGLADNPGGASLNGTTTVAAVAGVATFSELSIATAADGYTLAASSGSLTGATSQPFNVTAGAAAALIFSVEPTDAVAGAPIIPAVQVQIVDAYGNFANGATDAVTVALGANPGGGALSGLLTVNASGGVATFSDLNVDKVAVGYTLTASGAGLAGATSAGFSIVSSTAAALAFATQPASAVAGQTLSPVEVEVLDQFGNRTSSTADVSIALTGGAPGAVLSGTTTVAAVAGVATFSSLSIAQAGTGYALVATSPGASGATSLAFDITPAAASKLAFTVQPTNATEGASLSPAVQVTVQDAFNNTVSSSTASITVAIGNNPGGGTLSGTTTVSAVSGVATFSNLSIDMVGTGYTLTAASAPLTGATSSAFDITGGGGGAVKLGFPNPPTSTVAGALFTVRVAAQDPLGNTVANFTGPITLALYTNPGGGTLSCTANPVNAVAGIGTFTCSIDKAGVGYRLQATSPGLIMGISITFNIYAGLASRLAFTTPSRTFTAGTCPGSAQVITVQLQDAFGNPTAALAGGIAFTASSTSTGMVTWWTETTCSLPASGGNFTIAAGTTSRDVYYVDAKAGTPSISLTNGSGLTNPAPQSHTVLPGAGVRLAFWTQPSNTVAGATISPAVQVEVLDGAGNRVTSSSASVTLFLNPSGITLGGTLTVNAVNGLATFSDLSVTQAGVGYTLSAGSGALIGATSAAFDISHAAASKLAFTVQPTNAVAGVVISPAVQVTVQDAFNNTVTTSTAPITLALGTNPGGGTLSGTTTVSAASGVATFSNLSIDMVGMGYTLTAASAPLTGATSSAFNITIGGAIKVGFVGPVSDTPPGAIISPPVQVALQDALGNTVPISGVPVTLALSANPGLGTLSGTLTVNAVAGIATFSDLSIDKAGVGYRLSASSPGLMGATSNAFNIGGAAAPSRLAFTTPSRTFTAGACGGSAQVITVQLQDAFGNPVAAPAGGYAFTASSTSTGTVNWYTDSACSRLASGGSFTIPYGATNRDVYYKDTQAGTPSISLTNGAGLTNPAPQIHTVIPAAPTRLAFLVQPTSTTAGSPISPAVQVAVQDAFGNTVTSSTASITAAIGTNPGGGTLSGTTTVSAINGVASFPTLSIDMVGTGYTLTAASALLAGATSSAFDITGGAGGGLVYTDPAAGGKVRLVVNTALSTPTTVVLDLVAAAPITGYSVGMDLPLDTTRAQANATLLTPGTALPAGSAPIAAAAVIPTTGPLASVLVTGQSQKAAGAGAVTADSTVAVGALFYRLRLDAVAGAPAGVVFDGATLGPKFRAALRDKLGTDVAMTADFRIGRLEIH